MQADALVLGSAWSNIPSDTDLQLDEIVFDVTSRALRSAGVLRHHVQLSVISSLDLYDGRAISNAFTAPAAAGYLNEEHRVEGDAMGALLSAIAALAAGQVECAVVVGLHVPEIGTSDEREVRRLREKVSSYTFDAHLDRPVGMTGEVTLGLHASSRVQAGLADLDEMSARSAADATRGAARRGVRKAVDADGVRSSTPIVDPLTELMLPASSAGAGAVVLSADVLGRRSPRPQARITGWGMATSGGVSQSSWLERPAAATGRAADQAYVRAGLVDASEQVDLVELSDLSPALSGELLAALRLEHLDPEQVNPSGGVRANHPGIANGLLRVIEASEAVSEGAGCAVAHGMDDLCGLVSSTASVVVLEEIA
jgi:hypothetical protein